MIAFEGQASRDQKGSWLGQQRLGITQGWSEKPWKLRINEIYAMRYLSFQVAGQVNSPEQSDLPICRYQGESVDQKFQFSDLEGSVKMTATLRMEAHE